MLSIEYTMHLCVDEMLIKYKITFIKYSCQEWWPTSLILTLRKYQRVDL